MIKTLVTFGLVATVARALPVTELPTSATGVSEPEHTLDFTVTITEPVPTQPPTDGVELAAFGLTMESPTSANTEMETETPTETDVETPTATATPSVTESTEPTSNNVEPVAPVAPVVPVHICTNNGTHCLTNSGSEFADVKLSWDQVAKFNLGPDGLLVRLDDLKCVDVIPMDDYTWYEFDYVNCTLPKYFEGALALDNNGIGDTRRDADVPERHTAWYYNETSRYLCANVNNDLGNVSVVCMYSDEGYAMLGTGEDMQNVDDEYREVAMPIVVPDNLTLSDHLYYMIEAMTYDGSVFWAQSWDTNIQGVMKYRMLADQSEEIDMDRDAMQGVIYPLWQVINECRQRCDMIEWCHSFTFPIDDRVCRLSSAFPVIKPEDVDPENPDVVTFVQNNNYDRDDFILKDDDEFIDDISVDPSQVQ